MNISCSNGNALSQGHENQILLVARMVREHYFPGRDRNFPDWLLVFALLEILDEFPTASAEELYETMTLPANIESPELRRRIHSAIAQCRKHVGRNMLNTCVFRGGRPFTFDKVSAMSAYFSTRAHSICSQKLDRLLFYSDFVHYCNFGESISGARYVRQWDGPGQELFERQVESMLSTQILRKGGECERSVQACGDQILNELSVIEIATLNWVQSNFGSMPTPQLGETLRQESSHKFTRRGDYVAYEYSKLFQNVP